MGKPVWMTFTVENLSHEPITLTVPGTEPEIPLPEMGLPLAHVFSGGQASGVMVTTQSGRTWDKPVSYRRLDRAPIVMIAPQSTVGTRLDLREFFPALRAAGQYRIRWNPYGGAVSSEEVAVVIAPLQDVEIVTDEGKLTIHLFYEDAPQNVANFLDLVKGGFYSGKTFHRIEPGYLIQGGCPRGDGTGIRADGSRLPAEHNSHPHRKGSLSMALLDEDPASGSCQFFISNTRMKEWDGLYTVFGQLVGEASYETLDRLMATEVDERGRPRRSLYLRSTRLVDRREDEPPEVR